MEFLGDVDTDVDSDVDVVTHSAFDCDTTSTALLVIREVDPTTSNGKAARDESFESSTAVIGEARQTASRLIEITDDDVFLEEEEPITAEEAVAMFKGLGFDKEQFGSGDDQYGGRTTPENAEENNPDPGQGSHPSSSLERCRILFDALEALAEAHETGGETQEPPPDKISVEHSGDVAAADGVVEKQTLMPQTATKASSSTPSSSSSSSLSFATTKEDLHSWKEKRERFLASPRPKLKPLPDSSGSKLSKREPSVPSNTSCGKAHVVGSDSTAALARAVGVQPPDMVPVPLSKAENPDREPKDFFEAALDTMGMDTICWVDEESLRQQLESLDNVANSVSILSHDPFANNPLLVPLPREDGKVSLRQDPILPQDPFANNPILVPLPREDGKVSLRQDPILPQDPFANNPILVPLPREDDEESLRQDPILPQDPFANNPVLVPLPPEESMVPQASCHEPQKLGSDNDSECPLPTTIRNTEDIFAIEALVEQGGPTTTNKYRTDRDKFSNE
jgi:hypothetical protein